MLQELEAGAKPADVCRRIDPSETTIQRWRRKYGGLQVSAAQRLKASEDESRHLRRILADQTPNLKVVKDLLGRGW